MLLVPETGEECWRSQKNNDFYLITACISHFLNAGLSLISEIVHTMKAFEMSALGCI